MPQSGERVLVSSGDGPWQKLHCDFENATWNKENEERLGEKEAESQAAGYFAMASGRLEMLFWICEGSHSSARAVYQSRAKEVGRDSAVHLVELPLFLVLVVSRDTSHAGSAWTDEVTALRVPLIPLGITSISSERGTVSQTASATFWIPKQRLCSHHLLVKVTSIH